MASSMSFEQQLAAIEAAAARLVQSFCSAGPDATVATCPGWRARDLVVHQGVVHRWAAGNLRGQGTGALEESEVLATVADGRLVDWFRAGARQLTDTLTSVAPDVDAVVFLNDAPRPREFWARRQAHETTIHAVDGLAAALGRMPTAAEADVDAEFAADGIDELLRGFFTRGRSRLYAGRPVAVRVVPDDVARSWTFRAGPEGSTTGDGDCTDEVAVTFTATAAQLYLGLWNRGDEISAHGDPSALERWRTTQHVTWG